MTISKNENKPKILWFKISAIIFSLGQSLSNSTCQTQGMKNENNEIPKSPCCNWESKRHGENQTCNGMRKRFRCCNCKKTFSEPADVAGLYISTEKIAQVVQMLCEGVGIRAASRMTGLMTNTVTKILVAGGKKAQELLKNRVRGLTVKHVEIDEVYGFVGCLQSNTSGPEDFERGDQWAYIAVDGDTKMILNVYVGKRATFETRQFLSQLREKIEGRFQLTSDGYQGYVHHNGVKLVFGNGIDYATEVKTYRLKDPTAARHRNPVVCNSVQRVARIGDPDMSVVTTNHAERCNLSVRLFNRRFTRKTMGFSRRLDNHTYSVVLQAAHFNFCRVHSSLKKTPAMAAGLTDHVWTARELLTCK